MPGFDRFLAMIFDVRSRTWRRTSRLVFAAGLLVPGWSMAAQVCDVEVGNKPPARAASGPVASNPGVRLGVTNPSYLVACASKQSTCLVSDQLTVTPVLKDAAGKDLATERIQRVCLQLMPTSQASVPPVEQGAWSWVRQDVGGETVQPVTLNLASILRRWLDDANVKDWMAKSANGKQPIQVSVVTAAKNPTDTEKLYQYEVELDLNPLWQDGTLPLKIEKVECNPCALGNSVTLTIPQLATWMVATKTPQEKLTVFIGGVRMAGLEPAVNKTDGTVRFQLKRHLASAKDLNAAWANALPDVLKQGTIRFALGDDKSALTAEVPNCGAFGLWAVALGFSDIGSLLATSATLAALVGMIIVLCRAHKLVFLRDRYDNPWPLEERPFSLGRTQMAWWTLLVLLGALVILWRTGDAWSINLTALTLMGIGGATLVGSVSQGEPSGLKKLMAKYTAAVAADTTARTALTTADVTAAKDKLKSKGWLHDVLSEYGDDDGTAVHRLQNVLFTVVFGAVFFWLACSEGSMPELPPAILGLLGISGSVYVGYKWRTPPT